MIIKIITLPRFLTHSKMPSKQEFQWVEENIRPQARVKKPLPWATHKETIIRQVQDLGLPRTIEYMKREKGFYAE
jgi:hypothetical protein